MRLLAVVLVIFTLPGCAAGSGWHNWQSRGVTASIPPGWDATSAPLSPVTWPAQFLAIASYPLPRSDRNADGCEPAGVNRLPADGAFIFGWEYVGGVDGSVRKADFRPRPRRFRLVDLGRYECLDHSYLINFRAAGRYFQVQVRLGRHASLRTRKLALRVLDSLRVDRR